MRAQKSLYIVSGGLAPGPAPEDPSDIAAFIVDPVLPLKQDGNQRAPQLIEDRTGVKHVALGCGESFYPMVPDFIHESLVLGISKRVPLGWDFTGLTPGKSKLLLSHPRAIPNFDWDADFACVKKGVRGVGKSKVHDDGDPECIGALWPLAGYNLNSKHEATLSMGDEVSIHTPSVDYVVPKPRKPVSVGLDPLDLPPELMGKGAWSRAIFLALPNWYLQWVDKDNKVPKRVARRASKTNLRIEVVPE